MKSWGSLAIWIAAVLGLCAGAAHSSYVSCAPGSGGDLRTEAASPLVLTIDVSQARQTIRNFGASDAWAIQFVGQWPDSKRDAIADLLFHTGLDDSNNPRGIGLTAWRFNVGAGSSRQTSIRDSWRRADMFLDESLTGYDWSRCPGQRWFLQAAKARGVEQFIAFVNSPPINMTRNGQAYCPRDSGTTNLRDDKVEAFAAYLAAILKHFRDEEGIDFNGVSPFNEPNWDWDGRGQEGCRYDNADIHKVVTALHGQLRRERIDTQIEIVESGDLSYLYAHEGARGDYIDAFFDRSSRYYVGDKVAPRISSHSYFTCWPGDDRLVGWRQTLRARLNQYPGLGYAMTEYCILVGGDSYIPSQYRGYGNGRDLGIDPALWVARVIHYDLTVAEASDWQWWLAVSAYNYKDGLVYVSKGDADGRYWASKTLWAVGNFSRFIRPGMKRVVVSRSDNATPEAAAEDLMVSAYHKQDDGTVAVVFVNHAAVDRPVRCDFTGTPVVSWVPYVTRGNSDDKDNLTAYRAVGPKDHLAIPARSVVTLVGKLGRFGD